MSPYLSFVVAARNDNYGGDFLHRMQVFLNVLFGLWAKHSLDAELVIVEWNPPENKPRLQEVIAWPKCLKPGMVRILEVPKDLHDRLPNSDRMPIFEYIAKNVGIRRARGEFVLATNPDLLFSDGLIRYLAATRLREACFYRVDRYDVAREIPLTLSVDEQLRLCSRSAFVVHRMGKSVPLPPHWLPRLRKYFRQSGHRFKPRFVAGTLLRGARRIIGSEPPEPPGPPKVHIGTPGDFLLMSAKHWQALRGYPELPTHTYIDCYMVYVAAIAGLRQIILRYGIYHQEHDHSEQAGRPWTVPSEIPALQQMLETRRVQITNGENWGLGDIDLRSVPVTKSASELTLVQSVRD